MIWDLQSDMLVNLFIRESYLNFLDSFMFFNKEIYSQTVIFTDKFKIVIVTVVIITTVVVLVVIIVVVEAEMGLNQSLNVT